MDFLLLRRNGDPEGTSHHQSQSRSQWQETEYIFYFSDDGGGHDTFLLQMVHSLKCFYVKVKYDFNLLAQKFLLKMQQQLAISSEPLEIYFYSL